MAIANVSLTDTFDYWRTVTNSIVVGMNDKIVYFNTANANSVSISNSTLRQGNVYVNVMTSSALTDQSTSNIASAYSVNTVLNYAVTAFRFANGVNANAVAAFNYANTINAFAYSVENKANAAFQQANSFSIIVANTVPPAPVAGSIWWHNEYGKLFVYYKDGDTDQWVDTSPAYDVTFVQDATNVAFSQSNTSFDQSNTALIIANNTSNSVGFISLTANLAYVNANTKLANTSGVTFAGDLNFSGNLTLSTAGSNSSIAIDGLKVGYLEIPQIRKSADYVALYSDSGKHIIHPASDANGRIFTIPSNASVPYANGTVLTFINTANVVTINIASDTMYWAGETSNTGTRYLSAYGMATAVKIDSTIWIISGTNLS